VAIGAALIGSANVIPPTIPRVKPIPEHHLYRFKKLLSESWSAETAYPGAVDDLTWTAGNPCGQCGVSSVWLAEILRHQYSISSIFCLGSLIFYYNRAENRLDNHCWLEINGESGEELVLDLTCDQARGFGRPIVFDSKTDLYREQIRYVRHEHVEVSDLPRNPVWPRYLILRDNLHELASDNYASPKGVDQSPSFEDETLQLARVV
jgi:hypothetical protein